MDERTPLIVDESDSGSVTTTKVEINPKRSTTNNNFAGTSNAAFQKSFFESTDADFHLALLDTTFQSLSMSDEPSKTGIISQLTKVFSPTKSVSKKSQPVKRFENYSEAFASPEARVIPTDFLCKVLAAALSALDSAEGVIQNNQITLNEYTQFLESNPVDTELRTLLKDSQGVYKEAKIARDNKIASRRSNSEDNMSVDLNKEDKTTKELEKRVAEQEKRLAETLKELEKAQSNNVNSQQQAVELERLKTIVANQLKELDQLKMQISQDEHHLEQQKQAWEAQMQNNKLQKQININQSGLNNQKEFVNNSQRSQVKPTLYRYPDSPFENQQKSKAAASKMTPQLIETNVSRIGLSSIRSFIYSQQLCLGLITISR